MNRYELAIAGADWLEQNPRRYNFGVGLVNPMGNVCVLGAIGLVAGVASGIPVGQVAREELGIHEMRFYDLMSLHEHGGGFTWNHFYDKWMISADIAAQILRKVADKNLRTPVPEPLGYIDYPFYAADYIRIGDAERFRRRRAEMMGLLTE